MRTVSVFLLTWLVVVFGSAIIYAQKKTNEINTPHLESGLGCKECHNVDVPDKRAPQAPCIECHSDKSDSASLSLKDSKGNNYNVSIHASHSGQIRCTLCHKIHGESVLYCNQECHHTFVLSVP
ncbi:MAG: cytochrome c3 family protein [Deferribacteraceae bacterium]|jgi:fumarate reductase flavoprotein subunit|nr:cytochrome c3 family protein [Deferribacteraceae bacterium]